jgi:phage terminase small subunit
LQVSDLTPKQEKYCQERAAGEDVAAAAATAGVSERTAYYWHKLPAIDARIDAIQDEAIADVRRYLRSTAMKAARQLVKLQTELASDRAASARVAATKDHLDRAGLKPATRLEHTGPEGGPIEHDLAQRIVGDPAAVALAQQLLRRAAGRDAGDVRVDGE